MDDPIHDYATIVNEAERQRRILEQLEKSEASKPILTPTTKLVLALAVLVGLGAGAWNYAKPWYEPPSQGPVPDREPPVQAPPLAGVTGGVTGSVKLDGTLGEEVSAGNITIDALAVTVTPTNIKDVTVAGLLAVVGNGGPQVIHAPAVNVFLYDAKGRQYSTSKTQEGKYHAGTDLNPLIKQDARWVFIVPAGVELTRAQFQAAGGATAAIDLSKSADSLESRLIEPESVEWLADLDRSIKKAADEQNTLDPATAAERQALAAKLLAEKQAQEAQVKTLQGKQEAAARTHQALADEQNKLDDLQAQLSAAKKAQPLAEKHLKTKSNAAAKAQNDLENATAALQLAKQEQTEANTALQQLTPEWIFHNAIIVKRMEVRLKNANQNIENWTDAESADRAKLDDEHKALTTIDAELNKSKAEVLRLASQLANEARTLDQLQKQAATADEDVLKLEEH